MGNQPNNLFSAFSPLNGGTFDTYGYPNEFPYDLDAGLDYTRFTGTYSPMPFPQSIGYIDGLVPLLDTLRNNLAQVHAPNGPFVGAVGIPIEMIFPNNMGSLIKVTG